MIEEGAAGNADGQSPRSAPIQGSDGNFYGTTAGGGGASDAGTVYKITPGGVETVLHSFTGALNALTGTSDGAQPIGGLFEGSDGNLYGTTAQGRANKGGTIFILTNVILGQ